MTNFSNMQELMTHLINGGAITNMDDSCKDSWVSFYKGSICYPDREDPVTDFGDPKNWRPVPVQWLTDSIHKKTLKIKEE